MASTGNLPPPATDLSCVTTLTPRTEAECQTIGLCTHCQVLQLNDIAADQISASQKYELSGPVKIDRLVVAFYENQLDFRIESPSWTMGITFYIAADPGLRGAEKLGIFQQHVPEDLLSEAGISNVRKFIDQAVEWSPLSSEVAELPTRLLDVGGRPEQQDPRLVVSSEHPPLRDSAPTDIEARRYIALSYCWGTQHGAPLLRTERATLPSFAKGIPLSLFPPALRDAVLVTRRVGSGDGGSSSVRYLWIDALCIVQDDRRDWEREAARMAAVYRNAYLTFCSTQASCALGFAHRPAPSATVPLSPHLAPLLRGSYHLTEYMDETFAWEDRAWTFQELYFSARAVLFGRVQTYLWDTRSAREADPEGYARGAGVFQPESRRRWWESQVRAGMSWGWQLEVDDDDKAAAVDPYEDWYAKVAAYSQRSLTFAGDRLPAISALASHTADTLVRQQQRRVDATYAAGLWAGDLLRGLLWSISAFDADPAPSLAEYVAQRTDPARCVAPSWSWACQGEAVYFAATGGPGFAPLGRVEEAVDVRSAGLDAYGQVEAGSGRVVLSGWMARVPYAYFEIHQTPASSGQYDAVHRDPSNRSGFNSLRVYSTSGSGGEADVAFDWWVEDERHAEYWPSGSFTVLLTGLNVYPPELASSSSTSAEDNWELFRMVADLDTEPGRREVRRHHDGEVVTYDSIFVLGLVLHETEQPGVYLRAGYIRGSAFEDTLAELKAAEWRTVEIV
ncbi:putative heterokaryon incompatibility protein [Diplodia seriata]|uniref:Putative heterokaryon incompatibility protein n=1 Tax=Diplodia seriata TaxID=420778 RepID=A0A0G2HG43_9PEZI|nr:putative heterokaryon incompatibility protein [Diplodia seriata]